MAVRVEELAKRVAWRVRAELNIAGLALRMAADPRSAARLRRLLLIRRGYVRRASDDEVVSLNLRPLGGRPVKARTGSADAQTIVDVFMDREHLPPPLGRPPGVILDLGANVGLTMAHFATLYPTARVVGAELDPANAQLARENVEPWSDRCEVIAAGVWTSDGKVPYTRREGREVSHAIVAEGSDFTETAASISMNSLLAAVGPGDVDYVKMDIEGAERDVLRQGREWAARVRSIKVEIHPPYTVDDCQADLQGLGFATRAEAGRCAYVVGTRE